MDDILDCRDRVNALTGCFLLRVTLTGPCWEISSMMRRNGISWRVAILRAIYSASVVDNAISD